MTDITKALRRIERETQAAIKAQQKALQQWVEWRLKP